MLPDLADNGHAWGYRRLRVILTAEHDRSCS
jgi:hypothetical protein